MNAPVARDETRSPRLEMRFVQFIFSFGVRHTAHRRPRHYA